MNQHVDRFLRYAAIDTTSDEHAAKVPSSKGQWALARLISDDLRGMGFKEVILDENCYVYAQIPANTANQPRIALIAHLDTADAVPGRDFRPQVMRYDGEPLALNPALGIFLSRADFPELDGFVGLELVVGDGTTVLGADDKAGIVEIMAAAEYLLRNPEFPHGDVWLVFTPDEEIGSGAELLQLDLIRADFGYTVDGGAIEEIEFENFNAASAHVSITGRNVHPGYAKGKMINALQAAHRLHRMLPPEQCPELTEGYEGFFHLRALQGTEESATMDYIIRDHDSGKFEEKKALLANIARELNREYGREVYRIDIKDSYRNMKEIIDQNPRVLERAERAIRACGLVPRAKPIRGGTDGARLSFRGLPCPNLGTGGMNWHSMYEFLPVQALEKMAKVLIEIVRAQPV